MARATTSGPRIRGRGRVKLKGLKRYSVNGVDYIYHRASGTKLPSDIPEDHPQFLAAYLEAENGKEQTPAPEKSAQQRCRCLPSVHGFKKVSGTEQRLSEHSAARHEQALRGE